MTLSPSTARPPTLDEVCEKAVRLPCAPTLLPRLMQALQSEDSTAAEIEGIILLDSALAAATLRLANSAYFGMAAAETVEEAIIRVGQVEVFRLAALALMSRWEGRHALGLRCEPGDFSRHTLCTALAAEELAVATGSVPPSTAYTAGLVWEVGRLAMAHVCAEWYPAVRARRGEDNCTWERAERAVFGFDHAMAGTRLLQAWKFPVSCVHAAEFSLRPLEAVPEARPMAAHLHAGKYLATSLGPGVAEDGFFFTVYGDFLAEQRITPEMIDATMPVVLDRAMALLGERLSEGQITFS